MNPFVNLVNLKLKDKLSQHFWLQFFTELTWTTTCRALLPVISSILSHRQLKWKEKQHFLSRGINSITASRRLLEWMFGTEWGSIILELHVSHFFLVRIRVERKKGTTMRSLVQVSHNWIKIWGAKYVSSVSVSLLHVFGLCLNTGRKCCINICACVGIYFYSLAHVYSHWSAGLCRKPPWPTTQRTRSTPPTTCPRGSPCSLRRPAASLAEPRGWDLKWVALAVFLPSSLFVKSSCLIFSLCPDRGSPDV